jgi:hypothetical protein
MIKNLIILNNSGIPFFSKDFLNGINNIGKLGSLITGLINLSQRTTGFNTEYIELEDLSTTIIVDTNGMMCVLIMDTSDVIIHIINKKGV